MTGEPSILWFRADDRPELAARYHRGQRACYARHDVATAAPDPPLHRGVHMIAALDDADSPLAGMRVHESDPDHPLPVELALGGRCSISAALAARQPAPVVEMSGLWVNDGPLPGLAAAVTRAALAVCRILGARSVVGCAHQHVLPFYRRYGAVVDEALGAHPYPSPRYATRVVFADLVTLADAAPDEQAGVVRLTERLRRAPALRWAET